jgi:glutathione S-transferase
VTDRAAHGELNMSVPAIIVVGSYLSPFARKVLGALHLKGIDYRIDPIVPFFGSDEFTRISPLRRIPVLIDGDVAICDSSVICEYLDEKWPEPALLPRAPAERARARWIQEYADSRLCDLLIWSLFDARVIRPAVFGEPVDEAAVESTLREALPPVLDHLEGLVPERGFLFGEIGLADLSLAAPFRNAAFACFAPDAARWPRLASFVARVLAHDALARLHPFEELSLRTPPPRAREALAAAGAPIAPTTFGTNTARRGLRHAPSQR